MEGAGGIFEENVEAIRHGSKLWESDGRDCITSDVKAVCEGANACGIDEILLYDGHHAGSRAFNIKLEELPENVLVFDTADRAFFWRRIRGQAAEAPFGLITVGQHARFGEENAYFAHSIQTPPIKAIFINGRNIAEIGMAAYHFCGTRYLANIGCAASMKEAKEIAPFVACIAVKDKRTGFLPDLRETYGLIKDGVIRAISEAERKERIEIAPPYHFRMELTGGAAFRIPERFPWKGRFEQEAAEWEAPSVEIGLELFNNVRAQIGR